MTQLLVSVKCREEALIAFAAGVDLIDLKDPSVGALGALNLASTQQIVSAINGGAVLTATVGEDHPSLKTLIRDIEVRAEMGVDIIKIGVGQLFFTDDALTEWLKLTRQGIKMVAVFFADTEIDLNLLDKLGQTGFYGAMLDTQAKDVPLSKLANHNYLQKFTSACKKNHLQSGLAGSLKPQHIVNLIKTNPTFIGFRGGVCENFARQSSLSRQKVLEVKNMLREHNNLGANSPKSLSSALHS
ncbi:MAG: (5-formylfuran-3-yl)methyl phosphate synthase [Methylophilaceae bacterium]